MRGAITCTNGDSPHDKAIRDLCVAPHIGAATNYRPRYACRVKNVAATSDACKVTNMRRPFHSDHALFIPAFHQLGIRTYSQVIVNDYVDWAKSGQFSPLPMSAFVRLDSGITHKLLSRY